MTQEVGVDEAGGLWTAPGSTGGESWFDIAAVDSLEEDVSELAFSNLSCKKIMFYGLINVNDADSTKTTGDAKCGVYLNNRAFDLIIMPYMRTSAKFIVSFYLDVSSGYLQGYWFRIADRSGLNGMYGLNLYELPKIQEINSIKINSTLSGSYLFKAGGSFYLKGCN